MIDGLDDLLKALQELEDLDPTHALQEGGEVLLDGMQRRVAVDTGELKDSLQLVVDKDGVSIETDSDHAAPQEFGTSRMAAQPYMRPTMDEDGDDAVGALGAVLGKQIEGVGR